MFPRGFEPTGYEKISLESGVVLKVSKATPTFRPWISPLPGDAYGQKPVINFNGEPVFAELAILRAFEDEGWQGAWVDSYRNRMIRRYWPEIEVVELSREVVALCTQIEAIGSRGARCWDLACWRGNGTLLFAEAKRAGKDKMRDSQRLWLKAAVDLGRSLEEFLVVEWQLERSEAAV